MKKDLTQNSKRRRILRITRRALLAGSAALFARPALASGAPLFRDRKAPITARVKDLLPRMTLEEKAAQLQCMWERKTSLLDEHRQFSARKARAAIGDGIGQISRISDIRGYPEWGERPFRTLEDTVALANAIQRFLVEQTRLGIPALFHDELAHGLLANDATIFPTPPALASTWDPGLVELVFAVAAREARARGTHVALTPVVDLMRDPRYGRVEEFFGEDSRFVAEIGTAAVWGLQGRQRPLGPQHVFSVLKHFVHATPQGGLNISPADMSDRELRSTYLVPFQKIVERADPAILMPSYNEVQGVPSHANLALLQNEGRRRLGFTGAYFSDYGGIENLMVQHHVAGDRDDAAVLAMNAGVQADLPEGSSYIRLPELVRAGRIDETQVDAAVAQILALKFEAGLFENPYLDIRRVRRETRTPADVDLARKAAEKAIVLLKNDGTLPLHPRDGLRLAVIGPNAAEPLYGGYAGFHEHGVGILEGVRRAAPAGVQVEHAEGVWITPPDSLGRHRSYSPDGQVSEAEDLRRISDAVSLAARSDVILLVLGDVPAITREAVHITLPGDRSTLALWGRQDQLVEAMIACGKPIVALLLNGRPLAVPRLVEKVNALIEGWYLGEQGGAAFADVLFGKVNPGGKLPVSFPMSVGVLPVFYDHHPSAEVNRYIEDERRVLFPFGHGLSYTTFDISPPRLNRPTIAVGQSVDVEVSVTNSGERTGDEVVQLYIRDLISSVPRPVLELRAFERVTLAPGETRLVRFTLTPDDLALWDIAMEWKVEPGDFAVSSGPSSASLKSTTLRVLPD